jgi:predicted nuclease with TOPRIM domain
MTTAQAQPMDRAENEITEREKFYADLNRTRAETEKTYAEMRRLNLESSRSLDETMKMRAERERAEAESKKLAMDTMKTQLEIRWYTSIVSGSIALAWFSAGAAFVTALIKLLSVWGK